MATRRPPPQAAVERALSVAGTLTVPAPPAPPRAGSLDIVIPVYNNAGALQACLDSLRPTLSTGDRVWLLDDASEEDGVAAAMQAFAQAWPATECIRQPQNLGFVGTANRALAMTRGDVVLLNSDTEPADGWLEHLQSCLHRNPRAGIVCPLSDRASLLSVLPADGRNDRARIAEAAASTTAGDLPLPTAVGFCMLLRRAMLDELGEFSAAFAPGYGEENDLSMRALAAGWDILVADRACVFHRSGGSFGARAGELQRRHQARLDRIWPEYGPLVQAWWRDNPLRAKAEQLAAVGDARPALVHVLHRQYRVGGTERVTRSLIQALGERYRHSLLYPGRTGGAWCDFEQRPAEQGRELMLNKRWIRPGLRVAGHGADLTCPHSERALARVLRGSGARIVHFHHLLHWDSLLLPALARALGCRVVVSVHDFWFNCPIHNQLEHGRWEPCGRSGLRADARCQACLRGHASERLDSDDAAAAYARARQRLVGEALAQADAVLAPSAFIRDRLEAAFPDLAPGQVRVLPHGVERPRRMPPAPAGAPRVVAYFGGDQVLKGAAIVLQVARALADADVVFRVHGRIKGFDPAALPPNVELRGFYDPADVGEVMQGVDLALLPSHYEESFSMVASECWAHGVPVLASARGALRERLQPGTNGWLVEDMSAEAWVRALREALEGDRLQRCRERLARYRVPTLDESASAVDRLYRDLLARPGPEALAVPSADPLARFRGKLEALRAGARLVGASRRPALARGEARCVGVLRDHWGTANYRLRFPLQDLARAGVSASSDFHVVRESGFDLDAILRASGAGPVAVQPFLSGEGLRMMERLHRDVGARMTLVVDDLWTGLREDNPARAAMPENVAERLAYAASLCHSLVLTTPELERRLGLAHDRLHVINNALPEWVWSHLGEGAGRRGGRLRVGWAGAPQHGADLAFLEPVVRATADLADWVFLGLCPDALRPLAAEFHAMVPFADYPAALAGLGLDLAIAPLKADDFNRCKSHLKILEYGILGVPVVAADLEPYRHCPVPLVAPDDAAHWTAALRDLLEDHDRRLELGRSLRAWVLEHHLAGHRREDWCAALGIEEHDD